MKNYIMLASLLFLTPFQANAAEQYTIDPNHTSVLFHADHFGFSHPSGKWMANGTVELDKEKMQNSKVNVLIKMADLDTGLKELDKHLKDKLFLDVKKFPTATFVSEKVEVANNQITKIQGKLTVHGVTKPVTLDVKQNKMGVSPVNNKDTIGFTAHTTLLRSEFGVSAYLPGIADEIKIDIELEANKTK